MNFQSPSLSLADTEYISHKNTSYLPIKKIYLCLFQWKKYLKDLPRKLNVFLCLVVTLKIISKAFYFTWASWKIINISCMHCGGRDGVAMAKVSEVV